MLIIAAFRYLFFPVNFLKSQMLNPNIFEKMNVPVSTNLIAPNVSTGLYFMYTELTQKEREENTYLTTAWFYQIITKW